MHKLTNEDVYNRIIKLLKDGGLTREEIHNHFDGDISTGTISARCNDLLKLKILFQNKKRKTKTGCKAFILELNPRTSEWKSFDSLCKKKIVTDEQIYAVVKILQKSEKRKEMFSNLLRSLTHRKLLKALDIHV
jgi:hypothetical protein